MGNVAHLESAPAALQRAVSIIGSQPKTATLLGVSQAAVSKWVRLGKLLPAGHVLAVEAATGISRHDLRPDIYPRDEESPSCAVFIGGLERER